MRLRLTLLLASLAALASIPQTHAAPSPQGLWWVEDRSGIIEIAPCAEGICGRIVGQPNIRDENGKIPVDIHGVPHCGLTILHAAATDEPGHYNGLITNPDDGSNWHCEIWLDADGNLRLRGYVFVKLLGKTQTWSRFQGTVAADCSITQQ
jgi:uncharacterized protein (DUF2147 family)